MPAIPRQRRQASRHEVVNWAKLASDDPQMKTPKSAATQLDPGVASLIPCFLEEHFAASPNCKLSTGGASARLGSWRGGVAAEGTVQNRYTRKGSWCADSQIHKDLWIYLSSACDSASSVARVA